MMRVGFDLVEIERIRQSIKNPRFLERVYSKAERAQYSNAARSADSFAAAFAAKEAFAKALGTGIRGFSLTEVEILHDELGAPYYNFTGNALRIVSEAGLSFSLSLTHTETTAGAVAIGCDNVLQGR